MQSRIDEIHAAGAEVLAICVDSVEENAGVVDRMKLDFSVLSDPDLQVCDAFDLRHKKASIEGQDIARPAVFIVDPTGVVQWRELTDNWRVRVRPEQIIEQLRAMP